jgi:fido (protein-threonine AMPylation protein)
MFDKVWKWAGTYRGNELNIGCDPSEIVQRIPQLLSSTQYWLDKKTFPIDECLIRFHYQLVSKIHPFANGNGRHARMISDVVAAKYGRPEFSWVRATIWSRKEMRAPHISPRSVRWTQTKMTSNLFSSLQDRRDCLASLLNQASPVSNSGFVMGSCIFTG